MAIRTLLPFSSKFLCESGFSTLTNIKTKPSSKLDCAADLLQNLELNVWFPKNNCILPIDEILLQLNRCFL